MKCNSPAGFSLISLVLALAAIAVLYLAVTRAYRFGISSETEKALAEQGVDVPAGYTEMIERARATADKVQDAARKQELEALSLPGQ